MLKTKIIGLSGAGTCGKDSCFLILNELFSSKGIFSERVALADPLKYELNDFTQKMYGISAYTVRKLPRKETSCVKSVYVCCKPAYLTINPSKNLEG